MATNPVCLFEAGTEAKAPRGLHTMRLCRLSGAWATGHPFGRKKPWASIKEKAISSFGRFHPKPDIGCFLRNSSLGHRLWDNAS